MRRLRAAIPLLAAALLLAGLTTGCETPTAEAPGEATAPMSAEMQSALAALPADAAFAAAADVQMLHAQGLLDMNEHARLTGEWGARLQDFLDATGFDPQKDVRKVYVAKTAGPDAAPQMAVAADFDRARFQKHLEGEASDLFESDTYRGRALYRSTRDDRSLAFALTDGGLILAAPRAKGVHAMIDRLDGRGSALDGNDGAMRLIEKVRGGGSAWFVAHNFGQPVRLDQKSNAQGRRLGRLEKAVRSAAGAFTLDGQTVNAQVMLYAQDGARPDDIQNVIEGLVATVKSRDSLSASKRRAAESVQVDHSGDEVRVNFSVAMNGE